MADLSDSALSLRRWPEEQDALEEIYEPFLIQIGFLDRTPPMGALRPAWLTITLASSMAGKPDCFKNWIAPRIKRVL